MIIKVGGLEPLGPIGVYAYGFWLMHLDALLSQLNDVVSNSSSPATALSLTTEAEDFSMSQAVTYTAK